MKDPECDWDLPSNWESPDWSKAGRVHEWRNYISDEVREMWADFTETQRKALARQAKVISDGEDWD